MADVAVFLSNPGHHVETLAPVVEYLAQRGVGSRVHSFCELRGFRSPDSSFKTTHTEVVPAWPKRLKRSGRRSGSDSALGSGLRRTVIQELAWRTILAPRLRRQLDPKSRLAVLPNDSAFPYDRVVSLLRERRLPFVLVQEGIRFPLPAETSSWYGLGGAQALAVWGKSSAEHFRSLDIDPDRIHVTGSPRFDGRPASTWPVARRAREGAAAFLLITNPIDVQGFCSPAEKTALVASFVSRLGDTLRQGRATLTIRTHPGESPDEYSSALTPADRGLVSFDTGNDLGSSLDASDVAIVMASTVGLEALRCGVPLAVLPTPGHGYVHDYVARRAALGVSLDHTLEPQLIQHASPADGYSAAVNAYLNLNLADSDQATRAVGELMIGLLDDE